MLSGDHRDGLVAGRGAGLAGNRDDDIDDGRAGDIDDSHGGDDLFALRVGKQQSLSSVIDSGDLLADRVPNLVPAPGSWQPNYSMQPKRSKFFST